MIQHTDTIADPLLLLKYFHIFRHPLRSDEIHRFSGDGETEAALEQYLAELVAAGTLFHIGDYYLCENKPEYIDKREKGERHAAWLLPKARRVARFLSWFPFVRFIGISGSLSKGYADDKTDYDFFIITAANTLWICRTILHVLKKISYLAGLQHSFCMNYFIDESHLELEEKNIFTRIELSTLMPVYNRNLYLNLLQANSGNLPNLSYLAPELASTDFVAEPVADMEKNRNWRALNLFFMKLTDSKWRRKWVRKGYPMEDYPLAFKTTPFVSKNHPKNYQKTVLKQLEEHSR